MQLDPVGERVLIDRPGVRGAAAHAVSRSGSPVRRTSNSVIAAKGTSSIASISITPKPTR